MSLERKLPNWLRKPTHKKEVIATSKGWIVKDTGEILVSVKNLDKRIEEYFGFSEAKPVDNFIVENIDVPVPNEIVSEPSQDEPEQQDQSVDIPSEQESSVDTPSDSDKPSDDTASVVDDLLNQVDPDKKTWVSKNGKNKMVKMTELEQFLSDGWDKGRAK
jgi:hypothetical protein